MAHSEKIVVSARPDGDKGIFAIRDVAQNEILITHDGPVIDHATRHSIQIDDDKHIEGTENSTAFLNHGRDPTAYVDWNGPSLRARRMILSDEEITCNYFMGLEVLLYFGCLRGGGKLCQTSQLVQPSAISDRIRHVGDRGILWLLRGVLSWG